MLYYTIHFANVLLYCDRLFTAAPRIKQATMRALAGLKPQMYSEFNGGDSGVTGVGGPRAQTVKGAQSDPFIK